jgi:hypothetical protein
MWPTLSPRRRDQARPLRRTWVRQHRSELIKVFRPCGPTNAGPQSCTVDSQPFCVAFACNPDTAPGWRARTLAMITARASDRHKAVLPSHAMPIILNRLLIASYSAPAAAEQTSIDAGVPFWDQARIGGLRDLPATRIGRRTPHQFRQVQKTLLQPRSSEVGIAAAPTRTRAHKCCTHAP